MVAGAGETSGNEHRADFVAVESGGVGLVVEPRSTDVHRWGAVEESFFDGVAVQGGDRAQPARDCRSCPATALKVTGEAFDVVAGDLEQRQLTLLAPGCELAQVQRVRVAGETRVATQEAKQRLLFEIAEHAISTALQGQG